jgi:hypothetical protein
MHAQTLSGGRTASGRSRCKAYLEMIQCAGQPSRLEFWSD